jgi:hypothetical protein
MAGSANTPDNRNLHRGSDNDEQRMAQYSTATSRRRATTHAAIFIHEPQAGFLLAAATCHASSLRSPHSFTLMTRSRI